MRPSWFYRVIILLLLSILVMASCTPTAVNQTQPEESSPLPEQSNEARTEHPTETAFKPSETEKEQLTPTQEIPTPTPIIEARRLPEQWREWPVIPELTGRELSIYQLGLTLGNDPTHFSKVGDCQAIKDVLMGIYDKPDRYLLATDQSHLQESIDNFSGSFDRDGQGVRGGYNAAAVLSPFWADPEACNPGETPIECEYRLHKPSFVIISLEVWWEGRTVERYENYMREIIEFYIDNGVVPILSTKADNVEGDHRINLATARLAYEYHIPLWNFWRAVQSMPNHGIDPDRDGFHISYDAWTVRSFTALQALDAVWRGVRERESESEIITETPTPEDVTSLIDMTPSPLSLTGVLEGEHWIFSLVQRSGETTRNAGVFAYDPVAFELHQIWGEGYQLEDVDQTGRRFLISNEQQLYINIQGSEPQLLTEKFAQTGRQASAFWLTDNNRLVLLTDEGEGRTLWLVDPLEDDWQRLADGNITGIIPPVGDNVVYWFEGECDSGTTCEENTLWRSAEGVSESFAAVNLAAFDSDGETYAWVENTEGNTIILYTRSSDQTFQNFIYLPGNRMVDIAWAKSGSRLALLTVTRSDYTGKSSDARIFIVNTDTMSHLEYVAFPGLNPSVHWHTNGETLLLTSTLSTDNGYQLFFGQLSLMSGLYDNLEGSLDIQSEDFITIEKLFWINP